MAKKYYVVWKGRKTGIFDNWEECKESVSGFSGAKYKSFKTLEAAEAAFKQGYEELEKDTKKRWENLKVKPILESIAVDAAYSSSSGVLEYQGIFIKNNKQLFYKKFPHGTNNIGEFLAIVHALALLKKQGKNFPVYTDSQIALNWVKTKKVNTDFDWSEESRELMEVMARAIKWLENNDISEFKILKWDTKLWGEIPADFGRK